MGRRESAHAHLPVLQQIQTVTIADASPAASEAWTMTFTDDQTQQSESLAFTSGASLAATLDAMVAAVQASGQINNWFSVTEDGATVATFTARASNRSYTITCTPGGSATAAVAETQAEGGSGLEFGIMVANATNDGEMRAMGAGDDLLDCLGILVRTDANHYHSLDNDTVDAVDACDRGKEYELVQRGRVWVEVEEAVTKASPVHVRLAGTGTAGAFRGSESSSAGAELVTVTPTAAELDFQILIRDLYNGEEIPLLSANPDGSATATEICDAWRTAAATAQADGVLAGYTFGGTATLTITGPVGREFEVADVGEGVSAVAYTTAADVETLDLRSVARFETSASAGGLALLRINL